MKPLPTLDTAERWRLLLGEAGNASLGAGGSGAAAMDRSLAWLYGRDDPSQTGRSPDDALDRHGGSEASQLTVPEWINEHPRALP